MESVKTFFESFKELIWDIIGYLLPGSYILILLSVCVKQEYFVKPLVGTSDNDFYPFVFIVISYLLGYVAYGFGWFKEEILGKFSYIKKIESKVEKRKAYKLSKELISKALQAKGITDDLNNTSVRDIRNIAMSFIPENDQKIYTFTFRAELSNQIGNISILIGFIGLLSNFIKYILTFQSRLLSNFIKYIPLQIFKNDTPHLIIYACLIICYFLLRKTRNRFYAISVGLPFSIYTAKAIK